MPTQLERYAEDRSSRKHLALAVGIIGVAVAGIGIALAARRSRRRTFELEDYGYALTEEQATTIKAPLEAVEAAWVLWCASGHANVDGDYTVRFEPAPGARGTEVHLAGGGSTATLRDELRRFKQQLETGVIPMSDGPGLSRPAQPRAQMSLGKLAEVGE